jgi:hypothetical protein
MSISAKSLANVIPGVLGAGGNALNFNGVILTDNSVCPAGVPTSFSSYDAVAAFFGAESIEAQMAQVYFTGFAGSTQLPNELFFAYYENTPPPVPLVYFTQAPNAEFGQDIQAVGPMGIGYQNFTPVSASVEFFINDISQGVFNLDAPFTSWSLPSMQYNTVPSIYASLTNMNVAHCTVTAHDANGVTVSDNSGVFAWIPLIFADNTQSPDNIYTASLLSYTGGNVGVCGTSVSGFSPDDVFYFSVPVEIWNLGNQITLTMTNFNTGQADIISAGDTGLSETVNNGFGVPQTYEIYSALPLGGLGPYVDPGGNVDFVLECVVDGLIVEY